MLLLQCHFDPVRQLPRSLDQPALLAGAASKASKCSLLFPRGTNLWSVQKPDLRRWLWLLQSGSQSQLKSWQNRSLLLLSLQLLLLPLLSTRQLGPARTWEGQGCFAKPVAPTQAQASWGRWWPRLSLLSLWLLLSPW